MALFYLRSLRIWQPRTLPLINSSIQPKLIPRLLIIHNLILHRIIDPHHTPTTIQRRQLHHPVRHPRRPLDAPRIHRRILDVIALIIGLTTEPHGTPNARILGDVVVVLSAIDLVRYPRLDLAHVFAVDVVHVPEGGGGCARHSFDVPYEPPAASVEIDVQHLVLVGHHAHHSVAFRQREGAPAGGDGAGGGGGLGRAGIGIFEAGVGVGAVERAMGGGEGGVHLGLDPGGEVGGRACGGRVDGSLWMKQEQSSRAERELEMVSSVSRVSNGNLPGHQYHPNWHQRWSVRENEPPPSCIRCEGACVV